MRKSNLIIDAVLLLGLALMSFAAVAPEALVMPNAIQMLLLAVVTGLIAAFLVFIWREKPRDERESQNQAMASRMAYVVGSIILIVGLLVQGIRHDIDPVLPIALFMMIATKILVQLSKDKM